MKKLFLLLAIVAIWGSVSAEEIQMLTCSRMESISNKIESIEGDWCKQENFLKNNAPQVFNFELAALSEQINDDIFLDNVNNSNILAELGTLNLREHRLCLEEICHLMWNNCNTGKPYTEDNAEIRWCEKTVSNFFEIGKIGTKTSVIGNQQRKSRGSVEEKLRAIGVRMQQYFKPNLISFIEEFKRFTGKITAFVINPLQ